MLMRRLERTPDRRIERRNLLYALDCEVEGAAGFFAPVVNRAAIAFDPLDDAAAVNTLQPNERVAAKGEAPAGRRTNVDTEQLAVNASGRVAESGERDASERGPEQC